MTAPALLVDSNVWIDFRTQPQGDPARSFVTWCLAHDVRLGIAAHSLKDVFNVVERDLKRLGAADPKASPEAVGAAAREVAWATVKQLVDTVEVVGSDYMDALLATKYRNLHDFYEDNLIIAACHRMKADALVTSDRKLIGHAPILAMTPADAQKWLEIELG